MGLQVHALGHFHPPNELTNAFLEALEIDTSDEWIVERTGIRSRRTALPLDYLRETKNVDPRAAIEAADLSNAEMGAQAAAMALSRAGLTAQDVGLLIGGGCAPDTTSPAEACNIARALGASAPSLDVNSACTSFLAGLHLLSWMDPAKLPRFVLLVCAEAMTRTVDYSDRSSAVLWGDGAVAAVLSPTEPGRAEVLDTTLTSDPSGAETVVVPRLGHFHQEGRTVQSFAIRKTGELYLRHRELYGENARRLNFIGHQANLRMLESVCRRCEIDGTRHHSNCEWFGNTGGSSSGAVTSQNWEKWHAGDDVSLVGVGSGLSWASALLRFGEGAGAAPAAGSAA